MQKSQKESIQNNGERPMFKDGYFQAYAGFNYLTGLIDNNNSGAQQGKAVIDNIVIHKKTK